jgi:hypothetical protein
MRRPAVLAALALAILGGLAMVMRDGETAPAEYAWSTLAPEGYADYLTLAEAYPARDLPADRRTTCRVGLALLPGDPLIGKARLILVSQAAPENDPDRRDRYVLYSGPAAPEVDLTLPRHLADTGFELWAYGFVDDGRRYLSWTTFGIEARLDCEAGSVITLLGDYDMEAGGRTLRVDPRP